jgi:hypothetical protein
MAETRLSRSLFLAAPLVASMTLAACGDSGRSAKAHTSVAKAEVSTTLPASDVSDEFLLATATAAAEAASVPHPVAVGVVAPPPEPVLPPPAVTDNAMTNAMMNESAPAGSASNGSANRQ